MWGTGYTPLNFLMLPYVAILGITLLLSGRLGLDEFYYPSLIPWIIGLPVFALPGWLFFLAERRFAVRNPNSAPLENNELEINRKSYHFEIGLAIAILIALSVRLIVFLLQGKGTIGNEEFGALFSGNGWAGHLQLISVALLMLLLLDNRRWPTWLVSAFILFFLFVYQVKSWIILPLLAVFFALLITQR
ncbi:MAG: hypothetical protein K2H68_00220, partial [Bacteroidales bacterium]|nr:hypothetical protein [Bacteroidales bacterium]